MANVNLTKIEHAVSKLNVADLAMMTLVEAEPGNRNLDDVHFLIQEAKREIKKAIEED